ncbi:hypothetical protein EUX98_g9764, partial [Antrodiella citrinella]
NFPKQEVPFVSPRNLLKAEAGRPMTLDKQVSLPQEVLDYVFDLEYPDPGHLHNHVPLPKHLLEHPVTTGGGMTYLLAGFDEIRSVALQDACDQGIYPDDISDSSVPTALRDSPTLAPSLRVHKLTLKVPYQWHLWTWVRYDLRRSVALDRLQVLRVVDCDERHLQRVVTDFGKCATSIKVTQQDFDDGVPLDLSSHTGLKNLQLALSTTSTACYYNTEKLDLIVDALNTLSPHQLTSLKIETNLHISESYCDDDLPGDLLKRLVCFMEKQAPDEANLAIDLCYTYTDDDDPSAEPAILLSRGRDSLQHYLRSLLDKQVLHLTVSRCEYRSETIVYEI